MYGAILGDIAGSLYEFTRPEGFDWRTVELFSGPCTFTDDTVLTVATKYAVLTACPTPRPTATSAAATPRWAMGTCSSTG